MLRAAELIETLSLGASLDAESGEAPVSLPSAARETDLPPAMRTGWVPKPLILLLTVVLLSLLLPVS
jgi:hypothetical protein